jgi:hypothetical protein
MLNQECLDNVFRALADPGRRSSPSAPGGDLCRDQRGLGAVDVDVAA